MNYLKVTLARRARDVAEAENKLLQEKNKYVANLLFARNEQCEPWIMNISFFLVFLFVSLWLFGLVCVVVNCLLLMDGLLPQMLTFSFISSGSFSTLLFLQTAEYFSENQEIWIFHQNRRCWIFHEIPCRREKSLPERDKELAFKERSHRRTIVKWGQQQEQWLQEGQNIVVGTCRRSTSTISTTNVAAWQKQQIVRARCPKLHRIMKDWIQTTTKMRTTRKQQD